MSLDFGLADPFLMVTRGVGFLGGRPQSLSTVLNTWFIADDAVNVRQSKTNENTLVVKHGRPVTPCREVAHTPLGPVVPQWEGEY